MRSASTITAPFSWTTAPSKMAAAVKRITPQQHYALNRAIDQLREYQMAMMPADPLPLVRPGVTLGMRFTDRNAVTQNTNPSSHWAAITQTWQVGSDINHLAYLSDPRFSGAT